MTPVKVKGKIDGQDVDLTILEGTTRPFKLGVGKDEQEVIASIGCEEGRLDYKVVGPGWIHQDGRGTEETSSSLGASEKLRVTNPMLRENYVEAEYTKPGRGGKET